MDLNATIPVPDSPFLRPDGRITDVWWNFLLMLFYRTGGGQGTDPAVVIAGLDVNAPIPVDTLATPLSSEVLTAIQVATQEAVSVAIAQQMTMAMQRIEEGVLEMTFTRPSADALTEMTMGRA